jgi:hypothetical protein
MKTSEDKKDTREVGKGDERAEGGITNNLVRLLRAFTFAVIAHLAEAFLQQFH